MVLDYGKCNLEPVNTLKAWFLSINLFFENVHCVYLFIPGLLTLQDFFGEFCGGKCYKNRPVGYKISVAIGS